MVSGLAGLAGGEHARLGVEADTKRRFRLAIEHWARARGLWADDGSIAATSEDGCTVTAALFEMTENIAVVKGTAHAPASVTLTAETTVRSWMNSLVAKLGSKPPTTGDVPFDERFTVRTSDEAAMRQLLDDGARAALLAMDGWCSVKYTEGRIELRLDTPRLAGAHLLQAIEIVAAIARTRVQTNAYR